MKCFIPLFIMVLLSTEKLISSEYEISGQYSRSSFSKGVLTTNVTRLFMVSVSNDCWIIKTTSANAKRNMEAWCCAYSGSNEIYIANYFSTNNAAATILSGSVPTGLYEPGIPHLWLMYASGEYLKKKATNALPVLYQSYEDKMDGGIVGNLVNSPDPPFLPEKVYYRNDGYWKGYDKNGKMIKYPIPPPYEGGFTNAIYAVLARTNVGGAHIPLSFAWEEYQPSAAPNGGYHMETVTVFKAAVKSASPVLKSGSFLPEMRSRVFIIDKRLKNPKTNEPDAYVTRNISRWPTVKESAEILKEVKSRHGIRQSNGSYKMVAMLLLMVFAPIGLVMVNKGRK